MTASTPPSAVGSAYAHRAAEYAEQLGSMAAVHPADEHLVTTWAEGLDGPLLDSGCGPGHWTAHLAGRGIDVRGLDQVPAFVEHARAAHPGVRFDVGDVDALPHPTDGLAGVLAWYSLIHHDPDALGRPLDEVARVLRPGGELLVGFFVGDEVEPFDHAVAPAWRWSVAALTDRLRASGLSVLEAHTRVAATPGPRPHGAVLARLDGQSSRFAGRPGPGRGPKLGA